MNSALDNTLSKTTKGLEVSIMLAASLFYCGSISRGIFLKQFGIAGLINDSVYTTMYYGSTPFLQSCMICVTIYLSGLLLSTRHNLPHILRYVFQENTNPHVVMKRYSSIMRSVVPIVIVFIVFTLVSALSGSLNTIAVAVKEQEISVLLSGNVIIKGRRIASDENHVAVLLQNANVRIVNWASVQEISFP